MLDVTRMDENRFKNSQKIQRQNFRMNIWIILSQILDLKKKNLNNQIHKQRIGTVPCIEQSMSEKWELESRNIIKCA